MKHKCPYCSREFSPWYWYIPHHFGHFGTIKNRGLALANFNRHKQACARKQQENQTTAMEQHN